MIGSTMPHVLLENQNGALLDTNKHSYLTRSWPATVLYILLI